MNLHYKIADSAYIVSVWDTIKKSVVESFSLSNFLLDYSVESVIDEIWQTVHGFDKDLRDHFLVFHEDKIIGGVFSLPKIESDHKSYFDMGWLFVNPNLVARDKLLVAKFIVDNVHEIVRNSGYSTIVTEIGTRQGENLLKKRYGYLPFKTKGTTQLWYKSIV